MPIHYTVFAPLLVSVFAAANWSEGGPTHGGTAYAQSGKVPSIDHAALDRALATTRSELAAACGRDIPIRVDIGSFIKHPFKPSERDAASRSDPELQVERLADLGSSFSSHMQALCRKDSGLAGKVRSLVVRTYEEVADGKQDTANIYVDRMSTGNRYVFAGKADLRRGYTVYHLESGILSAYCDYSEGCTETDLRYQPKPARPPASLNPLGG